jgi:hypothetical protein
MPPTLRTALTLLAGLAIGGAGATLFLQSMPPDEGSAGEKIETLELELKRTNNQLAAYKAESPGARRPTRTLKDGTRAIAEDIRDGKPVTPDDIFRATQPLLRDLNPLFSRMRLRDQQRRIDAMTGEFSRKYALDAAQQQALKLWFEQKSLEDNQRFDALITQDGVRLKDILEATRDIRPDAGLDAFMEKTLSGEKRSAFQQQRMQERVERVQQQADMKVTRLDDIVKLDDDQRGRAFHLMASTSPDFDPAMQFEDLGTAPVAPVANASFEESIRSMLRPEQREAFQAHREQQRAEAQKDLEAMGLTLPADWDSLDPLDF